MVSYNIFDEHMDCIGSTPSLVKLLSMAFDQPGETFVKKDTGTAVHNICAGYLSAELMINDMDPIWFWDTCKDKYVYLSVIVRHINDKGNVMQSLEKLSNGDISKFIDILMTIRPLTDDEIYWLLDHQSEHRLIGTLIQQDPLLIIRLLAKMKGDINHGKN